MMFLVDHAKSFHWFFQLPLSTIKRGLVPLLKPSKSLQRTAAITLAMPRLAPSFIFILLILLSEMYLGQVGSVEDGFKPDYPWRKMRPRKVLVEVTLDYDYGGANGKHDPKKGKPGNGGGGKNP